MKRSLDSFVRWAALALAAAVIAGCGGGSGVDSGGTGITSQTLASGAISGFGSIVVGGVHYIDEATARITDEDGAALDASALKLGTTVTVEAGAVVDTGSRLESRALSIRVGTLIVGPVDAVDAATGTLRVLGQQVQVNAGSVFDAALAGGLASLKAGDIVAVHGQLDRTVLRSVATRLERRPGAATYVLQSVVSDFDAAARRLVLGGQLVDLSALAPPPGAADIAIGDVMRVRLRSAPIGGVWVATALRSAALVVDTREFVELEGRISRFGSAGSFDVDGVPVDASTASFPAGSAGLRAGARVEVRGRSVAGTVIATRVTWEADEDAGDATLEIEGRITALDTTARSFVLRGVTVAYTDRTRFDEGRSPDDLRVGRMAAVKGKLAADGVRVDATSVHVEL